MTRDGYFSQGSADAALLLPGCVDAWGPKALRAGMGAQLRLPLAAARTTFDGRRPWWGARGRRGGARVAAAPRRDG